jgi:hypothetical protein
MTSRLVVWGACVAVGVLFDARGASACGGGGVTTTTSALGVVANTQRIFMSVRKSGKTDIVVQIGVPATTADYGVLIPVPDEPELDTSVVTAGAFDALDARTAPKITAVTESSDSDGGGWSCGCAGGDAASDKQSVSGGDAPGVTVGAPQNIGPVTAVVLTGEDGAAVDGWLDENGFALPDESRPVLDEYAGPGKYFIAIKRNSSAADGAPSSIGLHYTLPGDHRDLSLRFARIGAAQKVAFTIFLAVPGQVMGPSAPFAALTLDDLRSDLLRAGDYSGAVANAVGQNRDLAFVLEASSRFAELAQPFSFYTEPDALVTRLSTVVTSVNLSTDVNFGTPFPEHIPNERYVYAEPKPPLVRYASIGWIAATLLGGALRRQLRPRNRRAL